MTKILIVEDEEAISDLIKMSLTKAGYHCEQAMDGLEAADCIENNNYDLILLDIMLPEINGYELLEYIKTKETPVIFITAMGELNDRVKGLRAGADDYITKPFEMIELLARVETVLRRYHIGNWNLIQKIDALPAFFPSVKGTDCTNGSKKSGQKSNRNC